MGRDGEQRERNEQHESSQNGDGAQGRRARGEGGDGGGEDRALPDDRRAETGPTPRTAVPARLEEVERDEPGERQQERQGAQGSMR